MRQHGGGRVLLMNSNVAGMESISQAASQVQSWLVMFSKSRSVILRASLPAEEKPLHTPALTSEEPCLRLTSWHPPRLIHSLPQIQGSLTGSALQMASADRQLSTAKLPFLVLLNIFSTGSTGSHYTDPIHTDPPVFSLPSTDITSAHHYIQSQ